MSNWMTSIKVMALLIMLMGNATSIAQDICVENALANSAMPTTIAEARQLITDLRQILLECDPPAEGVIELDVMREVNVDGMFLDDYGCYAGVSYGRRAEKPEIYVIIVGDGNANYLLELKRPGSQKFRKATDVDLRTFVDDPESAYYIHEWDGYNWPKGRYEVRYEAFVGADPVTLAFEAEYDSRYRIDIYCP